MNKHLVALICFFAAGSARAEDAPLDYETLSHNISVNTLRAGSHDPSGTNDYYFVADMYSLVNSSEERNLEFLKRKKIKVELGSFGETSIESLKTWRFDGKEGDKTLEVAGDAIRKLAAQSMQEFKILESEVAVMVEITMFEKAKKYYFFGEDTLIAKTEYFPISQTKYEKSHDSELTLQDDKGTQVVLKIDYKTPDATKVNKQAGN